jgi:hypothetical protein
MNKRLKVLAITLFSFFAFANSAFAAETPSFSSCTSPEGSQIAGFDDGEHGVLGFDSLQPGSDHVFANDNGAQQCFCAGGSGIQTNWWQIPQDWTLEQIDVYVSQGWTYVPDGSAWGLSSAPYLAKNVSYSCGGGGGGGNPSVLGSSTSNSSSNPPVCSDEAPKGAPVLLSVISNGPNSVTLNWSEAPDPVTYYLVAYGTEPGVFTYGNPNVGGKGTTSYTVNNLSGGVTYYFRVRAGNGCTPGPYSNVRTVQPTGGVIIVPPTGFEPGVLGVVTEATPAGEVQGDTTEVSVPALCASCIWWPILLGEAFFLSVLYALRRDVLSRKRWWGGLAIGAIALLIWWLLNKDICQNGVMNLVFFMLPCWMFFVLDTLVLITMTFFIGRPKSEE